jgi:hypothetical protein
LALKIWWLALQKWTEYAILTNRKRAIIALVHSIVFGLIALRGIVSASTVDPIWMNDSAGLRSLALLMIYLVVSSVLILLVRVSRGAKEKLYFAFCASSASMGLLRTIVGDQNLPASQYLRVLALLCAVLTGIVILRSHVKIAPVLETDAEVS